MFDWPAGVIMMRVGLGTTLPRPEDAGALAYATVHGFAHPPGSRER
jgi:hypothetical protein